MAIIKQLSREDVMFVAGETESIYQHVAGLIVLDAQDCPEFNLHHFRKHCEARIDLIPHFRWKLHDVPMGLDRPYWVEDEHFSYDHHIKRIALPAPGDMNTLCEVAANLYSIHMDHSKPLWEVWLIEGLQGGGYAYLQKFHHCMMDGEGALKMIEIIADFEPKPAGAKHVAKSISEARAGIAPNYQQQSSRTIQHLAQLPGDTARSVYSILRPKILDRFVWPRKPKQERPKVPTASFNGDISSARGLSVTSLSMPELLKLKKHFKVSLNDVVLALVGAAIRDYMLQHTDVPKNSLRTNIPVSLRSSHDDQISNHVTTTTVTLATNIADPVERLQTIHKESSEAKAMARGEGIGVVELFQMMPPILVSTLMESLPSEQAPQLLGANLIVSNVHGSPIPMYIAGAAMKKMYPMSILTAGMGINITCMSYLDAMDFGIMVDPDLVPGYETIAEGLQDALREYIALCKPLKVKSAKVKAQKAPRKPKPKPKPSKPKKSAEKSSSAQKSPKKKKPAGKPSAKKTLDNKSPQIRKRS